MIPNPIPSNAYCSVTISPMMVSVCRFFCMFWCIVVGCGMVHWCPRHSLDRGRGPLTNSSELRAWCPSSSNSTRAINQQIPGHYLCPCHGAERSRGHLGRCTRVKTCYADQYCSLLLQDIDLNSGDITDKLIMLQVEPHKPRPPRARWVGPGGVLPLESFCHKSDRCHRVHKTIRPRKEFTN